MTKTNRRSFIRRGVTAAAVVSILPILAIFLVCQRWVVQAVVLSGLKG